MAFKFAKILRKQADDLERHARALMHKTEGPTEEDKTKKRIEKALKYCTKKNQKNLYCFVSGTFFGI